MSAPHPFEGTPQYKQARDLGSDGNGLGHVKGAMKELATEKQVRAYRPAQVLAGKKER